jgi:ABC-type nickel/cobalt efflux system permease component RcnA
LVVLLAAIAYHRVVLGLVMVLSFSFGLAAVLIAIGIVMVLAGRVARRVAPPGAWVQWLPVASAVVIVVLGVALCTKALLDSGSIAVAS